jgi:hypothetical protein
MDTINEGRYDDTNALFKPPKKVDYHVSKWFNDTHTQLVPILERWKEINAV